MQEVFRRIALVAPHSAPVLITGESGVGKELVARAVHRHSDRSAGTFLPIHTTAIDPAMLERALFGHDTAASAVAESPDCEHSAGAAGDTVFLDEIADVPLPVQAKLLHAMEFDGSASVASDSPIRLDIRIIAATARDLPQLVEKGEIRQDLYYRLNVFRIHLPALRERPEDVPMLAEYFLRQLHVNPPPLSHETLAYLQKQPWPGNVREFRNALERGSIVARGGPLMPEHFSEPITIPVEPGGDLTSAVRQWLRQKFADGPMPGSLAAELLPMVESALIREVLLLTKGNRSLAAQWLGLDRATVRKKIQQYGLESEDIP